MRCEHGTCQMPAEYDGVCLVHRRMNEIWTMQFDETTKPSGVVSEHHIALAEDSARKAEDTLALRETEYQSFHLDMAAARQELKDATSDLQEARRRAARARNANDTTAAKLRTVSRARKTAQSRQHSTQKIVNNARLGICICGKPLDMIKRYCKDCRAVYATYNRERKGATP